MSETKMKPTKFETFSYNQYRRMLFKDLKKVSRFSTYKDYIYLRKFKFQGKGKVRDILLFVDPTDNDWQPTLGKVTQFANKISSGQCRVISVGDRDADGDEDFTIGIKTAEKTGFGKAGLTKDLVIKFINEDMFPNDGDLEAVRIKKLTDTRTGYEILHEEKKRPAYLQVETTLENALEGVVTDTMLQRFVDAYQAFFKGQQPKTFLDKVKELAVNLRREIKLSENVLRKANKPIRITNKKLLAKAHKFSRSIDRNMISLEKIIDLGEIWLDANEEAEQAKKIGHIPYYVETTAMVKASQYVFDALAKLDSALDEKFEISTNTQFSHDEILQVKKQLDKTHEKELYRRWTLTQEIERLIERFEDTFLEGGVHNAHIDAIIELREEIDNSSSTLEEDIEEMETKAQNAIQKYDRRLYLPRFDNGPNANPPAYQQADQLAQSKADFEAWIKAYNFGENEVTKQRVQYMTAAIEFIDGRLLHQADLISFEARLKVYNSSNNAGKKTLLKDKKFIEAFRKHIHLDEYLSKYHNEIRQIAPKVHIFEIGNVVEDTAFDYNYLPIKSGTEAFFVRSHGTGYKTYNRVLDANTGAAEVSTKYP
ncbi:MAG: hypothetical protein AAF598_21765, partial [Bacteroidota bacterium]